MDRFVALILTILFCMGIGYATFPRPQEGKPDVEPSRRSLLQAVGVCGFLAAVFATLVSGADLSWVFSGLILGCLSGFIGICWRFKW